MRLHFARAGQLSMRLGALLALAAVHACTSAESVREESGAETGADAGAMAVEPATEVVDWPRSMQASAGSDEPPSATGGDTPPPAATPAASGSEAGAAGGDGSGASEGAEGEAAAPPEPPMAGSTGAVTIVGGSGSVNANINGDWCIAFNGSSDMAQVVTSPVETRTFPLSAIADVSTVAKLSIVVDSQVSAETLTVTADAKLFDVLQVESSGESLSISLDAGYYCGLTAFAAQAMVRTLSDLRVRPYGDVEVEGVSAERFSLEALEHSQVRVAGDARSWSIAAMAHSDVTVELVSTGDLDVDASDFARIDFQGTAGHLALHAGERVEASGHAGSFATTTATVSLGAHAELALCASRRVDGQAERFASLEVACGADVAVTGEGEVVVE